MDDHTSAAEYRGVKVPHSPFLNDMRIKRINEGRYEGQEINGALSVVTTSDRVCEMGAGIGLVGAVIAQNAKPAAMQSFEANPDLIPHIRALYAMNGLEGRISVTNEVLLTGDDPPEKVDFHIANSYLGSSLVRDERRVKRTVSVPVRGFDAFRAAFQPSVLIMDIEGAELDFLEQATLEGIRAIVIEFHPNVYDVAGMRRCKTILKEAGFQRRDEVSTRTVWTCERPV